MRRTAPFLALPAVAVLALVGSACSSGGDDSAATTTTTEAPASTTTTTAAGSTTTTSAGGSTTTTRAGTPACTTDHLEGELGGTDAGAGQVYAALILRNTSSTACELTGFPGVSVLDASGSPLGEPASREGSEGAAVVLQPGGAASSTLHTTNAGIGGACQPASSQMQVYPPNQTEALTFAASFTVCGGFSVTTMVPGATGVA